MNRPRPLAGLLKDQENATLDGLIQRCRRLQQLEQRLAACLDIQSVMHCRVVNVHQGVLLLGVDSAAWATRLRYQLPDLLVCARRQHGLAGLQSIQLSILPAPDSAPQTVKHGPPELSRESALALRGCADSIEHDGLRQALERLAGRETKKKE